jgi:FkbM family methyltransferase
MPAQGPVKLRSRSVAAERRGYPLAVPARLYRASRATTGGARVRHFAARMLEAVTRKQCAFQFRIRDIRESPLELSPVLRDRETTVGQLRLASSATDLFVTLSILHEVCGDYFRSADCVPRPHEVVVDAGANVGLYSLVASSLEPSAQIIAFEPLPAAAAALRENLAANGDPPTIDAQELALGATAGEYRLLPTQNRHQGTFAPDLAGGGRGDLVAVVTLDERLGAEGTARPLPHIVKIDVEGFEVEVAQGAPRSLRNARLVMVEWHSMERLDELSRLAAEAGLSLDAALSDPRPAQVGVAYFRRT